MTSKFTKTNDKSKAEFSHDCNPQRPYAKLVESSPDKFSIECPDCHHRESHTFNGRKWKVKAE